MNFGSTFKYEELVTHRSLYYSKVLHLFSEQAPLASPFNEVQPQVSTTCCFKRPLCMVPNKIVTLDIFRYNSFPHCLNI